MEDETRRAPGEVSSADRRRRWRPAGWRRVAGTLVGLVAVGLAVQALVGSGDELVGAGDLLTRPHLGWLALAVAAELASYVAYAAGEHRLLEAAGRSLGLWWLTGLALAAQAMANCLPAGYALSQVLSFRQLRRRGLDVPRVAWLLLLTAGLYNGALALIALAGAEIAGGEGPTSDVRVGALVLLGVVAVVTVVVVALHRTGRLMRGYEALLQATQRASGWRRERPAFDADAWRERVRTVPLGARGWLTAGAWLAAAWLTDVACLAAAFYAVGATPPWDGLLLAYCAAQLVTILPITPGGLGVVEGSLTLALVAFGGAQESTLAAVLLYRLVSYWGLLPVGAVSYVLVRRAHELPVPLAAAEVTT